MATVKAIRVHRQGGPEVLEIEDVPDPTPGPGTVLVRVRAAGVNPVETYRRSGRFGPVGEAYTPGSDAGGVVEAVGAEDPNVKRRVKPGDRVYTSGSQSGTYAELALCKAEDVHPLPDHVSFAQGAAIGIPYATAWRALHQKARALPGEVVLVHGGSGGVGTAAIQIARAAGLTVIATGGTERGRALALEQGAHAVLDHAAPDYLAALPALTGGRGVDVVLEMLANVNLANDAKLIAHGGRIVVIGSRATIEVDPRDLMTRDGIVSGMSLVNASREERRAIHAALLAGLENRTLRPIVGRELPLAEAPRAHEAVLEKAHGKIVLIP
jgi:NADPH2:quinone reductase